MGKGTDLAREHAPEHAQLIDDFKEQLLIVLLNRLGGDVTIPISEVDGTGQFVVLLHLSDKNEFVFHVQRKQ